MKCIEDEIPFELPERWAWARLGNIGSWQSGATPSRRHPEYYGGTIPWLKTGDLNDGFINSVPEFITDEGMNNSSVVLNPIGSVLIAMYGATIGKLGITNIEVTTNQACCACLPLIISNQYLFYFLMYQKEYFIKQAVGGAQPNISKEKIVSTLFPVPPLGEQERIINAISNLLTEIESIANDKETITNILTKAKSKILDLAIRGQLVPQNPDDEPASVLLERIRVEKEALIKQGKIKRNKKESIIFKGGDNSYYEINDGKKECIDDDIPFELPDNWEWERLSNIVQVLNGDRGQNYPAKSKLQDTGIPFVTASNIDSGIVTSSNLLCMTEEQYNVLGAGKLITGDIAYCIRGSLGKCGIFTMEKGAIASSLVIVRPIINNTVISKYIFNYLNSNFSKNEIAKYDNGSAQPNLAAKDFMRFLVPVPPLNEQNLINNKLQKIHSYILQIEKSIL